MKAKRPTNSPKAKRSRKFMFSKFRFPSIFRKRRVSVTRMSARQTETSNHGTKPKPSSTGYLESRLQSMATTMATASTAPQESANTSSTTASSGGAQSTGSLIVNIPPDDLTVDRDEIWVQQLLEQQRERYIGQAQVIHEEYLAELASAGPFAKRERRQELEQRYERRLNEIKQLQQEEVDYYIEMERQQRLWSIGQQDPSWEGWSGFIAEQERLMAHIKRDSARSQEYQWEMHERTRENQREGEETLRRDAGWQKSEAQRMRDRQQWAERMRGMQFNNEARRTQDLADFEAEEAQKRAMDEESTRIAEEARQGAARVRAHGSQATLFPGFDTARVPPIRSPVSESSSRSSATESIFSSNPTADTAPSSVGNDTTLRPASSRPFPIPTSPQDGARRSAAGTFGGPSPTSRTRPPSTASQASPLSGTPISAKTAHVKNDQPIRATVWMPPGAAKEPGTSSRGGSEQSDGTKGPPLKKASMLFGASPGPPPPQPLADPPRESQQPRPIPTTQTQSHASQPQPLRATPSQTSFHAPSAPSARSHPLPSTPPKPQSGTSSAPHSSFMFPESKHSSSAGASATPPVNSGTKSTLGATNQPTSPADEYKDRAKVRAEYVRKEEERVEEERKRRDQEANERRAEDARRRGAEKRRQEEQAREAERREAERKTRKASINSMRHVPDRPVLEIWNAYESGWAAMTTATQLRFRSIPWPMLVPVSSPDMLLPIHIAAFILNPQHSQSKSRKDRLREALLRWHPDRFESKWLNKVAEEDRASVQEGVGCVVRALNDLLSAEGTFAA